MTLQDNLVRARDGIQLGLLRFLLRLPSATQLKISGRPAIVRDGQTLDPEVQLVLALQKRMRLPPLRAETPAKARRNMLATTVAYSAGSMEVRSTRDLVLDGPGGPLRARHYVPAEPGGPHPLLVFYHGGGFVLGDLETHDAPCRYLCATAGVHVLSIDYRLAPEHPFPAAIEDAMFAFHWAVEHARELGADPERVGVGGDSAGGNLSAVVSQLTRQNGATPNLQLLLYPAVDRSVERPSARLFSEGFLLTAPDMEWFDQNYTGSSSSLRTDPRVSPLLTPNLSGLCPAVIATAGFDPLRDEGEAYARMLDAERTKVVLKRFPGLIHGFIHMVTYSPAAAAALSELSGMVRALSRTSRSGSLS